MAYWISKDILRAKTFQDPFRRRSLNVRVPPVEFPSPDDITPQQPERSSFIDTLLRGIQSGGLMTRPEDNLPKPERSSFIDTLLRGVSTRRVNDQFGISDRVTTGQQGLPDPIDIEGTRTVTAWEAARARAINKGENTFQNPDTGTWNTIYDRPDHPRWVNRPKPEDVTLPKHAPEPQEPTTIDWILSPFSFTGATVGYLGEELKKRYGMTEDEWDAYKESGLPVSSLEDFKKFLPGGEYHHRLESSPLLTRMVLELPAFVMLPGGSALRGYNRLNKVITNPAKSVSTRLAAQTAQVAIAPFAGLEYVTGLAFQQTIGRVSTALLNKAYELATKQIVSNTAKSLGIKFERQTLNNLYNAYKKAFETHLVRELFGWSSSRGIKIDARTINNIINTLTKRASPKWAAQRMMAGLGRGKVTTEVIANAADETAKSAVKTLTIMLPRFTPGGTAVPGQTKPLVAPAEFQTAATATERAGIRQMRKADPSEIPSPTVSDIEPLQLPAGETLVPSIPVELPPASVKPVQTPATLKREVSSLSTKELEKRAESASPFVNLYKQELANRNRPPGGTALLPAPPRPATNFQKIEAHNIAAKLGFKDSGRRRLLQIYTGKRSMLNVTEDEAQLFIDVLSNLPKGTHRIIDGKRVLVPPRIPATRKVTPENFFNVEFKEPTLARLLTSQVYYGHKLGVAPLLEPLQLAKQRLDLEITAMTNAAKIKAEAIDKVSGTSLTEKARAFATNTPTKAIAAMRDALDQYENPPAYLSQKEAELFMWFRNLNRTLLSGVNKVRELVGLDPIPYRQAYVRHIAEGEAYEMLQGRHPFPESLKYWADRIANPKVFNPSEFERQIADDVEQLFTKDLAFATEAMIRNSLREIHLSRPLKAFQEQYNALTPDVSVYENLTADQLRKLRSISTMPASTRRWVDGFVNHVIKGQPTDLDMQVNRMMNAVGFKGVVNAFLKPFGRTAGQMPWNDFSRLAGRLALSGVLGPRPKLIQRNLFQRTQNLALYSVKANVKGHLARNPEWMEDLLNQSVFLKGYTGLEDMPSGTLNKLEKIWQGAYRWSAVSNARNGMKVAGWDSYELVTEPKFQTYGWADPQRTYTEPKGFLYPSEQAAILKEMEFGAGATQYGYIPMEMPEVFRHKSLVPLTRLQSWWMNHFFRFHREAGTRFFTGQTSYGKRIPWSRRLGYARYLILGGALLTTLGYKRSFLQGVLPSYLSPAGQVGAGMYSYITAKDDYQRDRALRQVFSSVQAFIPGKLAYKDFSDVWTGKKPLESLFFYTDDSKDKGGLSPRQGGTLRDRGGGELSPRP